MNLPRSFALLIAIGILVIPMSLIERSDNHPTYIEIRGEVRDDHGPVAGATVRVKGRAESTLSDDRGRFSLPFSTEAKTITAAKEGYFIAGGSARDHSLRLHMHQLPTEDCIDYSWVGPLLDATRPTNCGNCHKAIVDEWQLSGHSRSATNRRFLNLYEGTDWHGKKGVGWNLLKDHPDGAAVCSSCHAPTQKAEGFADFDIRDATKGEPGLSGVHCDFCHKIRGPGNGQFGLAHGRFQLDLLRPSTESGKLHQIFFGPLDDVDRGDDASSRFQRDSRLCAACHEGNVFGVPVYTTYSEWLSSPYAKTGTSCQTCHMKPTGQLTNIAPGHGGIRRDPATLGNHRFFDGSRLAMLRRCLQVQTSTQAAADGLHVDVSVGVQSVGHSVPTGFVDRQVILFVEGFAGEKPLPLLRGPVLPDFMGSDEARRPGRLYAKVLADERGKSPVPFWQAVPAQVKDTRLRPGETDRQTFVFPASVDRVHVRLVHRRFWKQVATEKQWPSDEEVILEREILVK